jgi:Flp pilus assembly protein TadB
MVESLTNRWVLALGLTTLCFGISLVVLHIPIRTIGIFFALGIPLILLWLYVSDKSRRGQHQLQQQCICSICNHEQAGACLNQICACCIIMKDNKVVGHSINPLQ